MKKYSGIGNGLLQTKQELQERVNEMALRKNSPTWYCHVNAQDQFCFSVVNPYKEGWTLLVQSKKK